MKTLASDSWDEIYQQLPATAHVSTLWQTFTSTPVRHPVRRGHTSEYLHEQAFQQNFLNQKGLESGQSAGLSEFPGREPQRFYCDVRAFRFPFLGPSSQRISLPKLRQQRGLRLTSAQLDGKIHPACDRLTARTLRRLL